MCSNLYSRPSVGAAEGRGLEAKIIIDQGIGSRVVRSRVLLVLGVHKVQVAHGLALGLPYDPGHGLSCWLVMGLSHGTHALPNGLYRWKRPWNIPWEPIA